jgi:acetyl esterase/lipase
MKRHSIQARFTALCFGLATAAILNAQPLEINLWPKGVPGEPTPFVTEDQAGKRPNTPERIQHVNIPSIAIHQAVAPKANGAAVVICPGGGYNILAYEKEGVEVANWLNSIGITAVVLKYRVPRRDVKAPHEAPLQDVQRALRLTRKYSAAWALDPNRIGLLGFSAGGHATLMAATHFDSTTYPKQDESDDLSCRPDFIIPIYPAYMKDNSDPSKLSSDLAITSNTPPMFLIHAFDDKDRSIHAALLFAEFKKAGVASELHIFSKGGHGYGLRPSANPVAQWPKRCFDWLLTSGWLQPRQ